MSQSHDKLVKLDGVTTSAQLLKVASLDELIKAYRQVLKSRVYHLDREAERSRLVALAIKNGLDK